MWAGVLNADLRSAAGFQEVNYTDTWAGDRTQTGSGHFPPLAHRTILLCASFGAARQMKSSEVFWTFRFPAGDIWNTGSLRGEITAEGRWEQKCRAGTWGIWGTVYFSFKMSLACTTQTLHCCPAAGNGKFLFCLCRNGSQLFRTARSSPRLALLYSVLLRAAPQLYSGRSKVNFSFQMLGKVQAAENMLNWL